MGKKNRGKKKTTVKKQPFVSVCTPTFNRRPFIPYMISCFEHQNYPKDKLEWIIIDDGTDKIEDLVVNIPEVKYFKYDKKMSLGEKRNIMHTKTKGDIIVYMDDDDYYPPERISHAVERLLSNPDALCAGSSEIYIYFKHIKQMYQFGPYGPKHATAGTFAFKRELLKKSCYDNSAALAEEKKFLKDYTIPFVQLDPIKTILVFSHEHNTFDKKKLLKDADPRVTKPSNKTVDMFIKQPVLKEFYMNDINEILKSYKPGEPSMKPDVLKQIVEIEEKREQMMKAEMLKNNNQGKILIQKEGQPPQELGLNDVVNILKQQQEQIKNLVEIIKQKDKDIQSLNQIISLK